MRTRGPDNQGSVGRCKLCRQTGWGDGRGIIHGGRTVLAKGIGTAGIQGQAYRDRHTGTGIQDARDGPGCLATEGLQAKKAHAR